MSRYDQTVPAVQADTRSTPLVVVALLTSAGLGLALLVLLLALGVAWGVTWRVSATVTGLALFLAAAGGFRRVWHYSLGRLEIAVRRDFNGDGLIGRDIQLVQVRGAGRLEGLEIADLRHMISRLDVDHQRGWTVREWVGERLPSGREIVSAEIGPYADFIRVLEKCGALVERTERFKGRLIMSGDQVGRVLGV